MLRQSHRRSDRTFKSTPLSIRCAPLSAARLGVCRHMEKEFQIDKSKQESAIMVVTSSEDGRENEPYEGHI